MTSDEDDGGLMRIGELAERTGENTHTLRVWERRFELLTPRRSPSGQRLYTERDVERVLALRRLVHEGMSVSAAAKRLAGGGRDADEPRVGPDPVPLFRRRFERAIHDRDIVVLRRSLEECIVSLGVLNAIDEIIIPFARDFAPTDPFSRTFFLSEARVWLFNVASTSVRSESPIRIAPAVQASSMIDIALACTAVCAATAGWMPISTYVPLGDSPDLLDDVPVVRVGHSHDLDPDNGNDLDVNIDGERPFTMFIAALESLG